MKQVADFVTKISRIIQTNKRTNIGCMYLEQNGVIGYHQAIVPQLLLIMNGEGYVSSEKKITIKFRLAMLFLGEKMSGTRRKRIPG